jgi:serine phosphatase RsbU (regulator of sigma subunit)
MAVSLVQAGHPAPLVRRADGTVRSTEAVGQLLGVTEDPELPLETVDLRSGDALVLVTDGLLEARNPAGDMFGEERLADVLRSVSGPADAQALLDAVVGAVDAFARGVCDDDQAVLVLVAE